MNTDQLKQLSDPTVFRRCVNAELEQALYEIERNSPPARAGAWKAEMTGEFEWTIYREGDRYSNYMLMASRDLRMLVVTHENTDAGPLSLHHVLQSATYIDVRGLPYYSLSEMIRFIVGSKQPNRIGLT